jgi:hypothetical protein
MVFLIHGHLDLKKSHFDSINHPRDGGAGCKMVRSRAPKWLWDDCLKREALVQSCTAHDIYRLNGQVPQTILKGEMANISAIALFCWYEWVMFQDTSIKFPEDKMLLGHDLGPAIDIRPTMARKVLKENGWSNSHSIDSRLFDSWWAQEWGPLGKTKGTQC